MRTKFLFSAALLATMFAACTNEDLVAPAIDAVSPTDGRPTVNVKLGLDLGSDATTRLIFDGDKGYQFAVGDQIGALLMDGIAHPTCRPFTNAEEWAKLSWLEKYSLTDYIHTDYPFACTEETTGGGTKWESNAKMLEGNYFFAYPYEGYDAKRQLTHSIIDQKQDGGTLASAMKSYADNQFFIGYAQIKEGNDTKDALTNVSMTSVLGAVRFQLKNIGTRDQKITKIVLSGDDISSVLTFNPLEAEYKGKDDTKATDIDYNLREDNGGQFTDHTTIFNYANYMGLEEDDLYENAQYAAATDFVYNIPATEKDNYRRGDALRAVVNTYETGSQNDNYAELALTDNGNEGIVAMANGQNIIEACIMINPITVGVGESDSNLLLSIYTTEGLIKDIDLSKVNEEQAGGSLKANTVITNQAVKNVGPEVRNVIELQFDNNSVQAPAEAKINNSDDLKQYVNWISTLGNKRLNIVELQNNAAIDAETAKLLDKDKIVLYVKALSNAKLQIANEAGVEDVLNNIIVDKECPIEILGTANIGTATLNHDYQALLNDIQQGTLDTPWSQNLKIEVAKGGTLNVIGTQLGDNVIGTEITNNGTLNIAEGAIITKAKVENYATMIVDGSITMELGSANKFKAEITVNKKGMLSGTNANNFTNEGVMNNHGRIWNIINANNGTMKPSTVNIYADATISNFHENSGEIVYDDVLNKEITFDQTITDDVRGTVKYTTKYLSTATAAAKSVSTSDLAKYNITDLTLTVGKLVSNTGRPETPESAGGVAYEPEKAILKSLIVKGEDIIISGKEYPLLMRGATPLIQIDGKVKLGTSIIIEGTAFDTESYLTGNITVTEKIAIASAGKAVFAGATPPAFSHSVFTAMNCGTIMKGAAITIESGDFLAVGAIQGVAGTSNSIDAEGTFYVTAVPTIKSDNIAVSGSSETIIPNPLSDK